MALPDVVKRLLRNASKSTKAILAAVLVHYVYILGYRKFKRLPPGPMPVPLLGNLLLLKSDDVAGELAPLFKKYGNIFTFWFGNKPAIIQCDPKVDYELMVEKVDDFNARPKTEAERVINYDAGHCEGIHSAEGPQWAKIRKVLVTDLLSKANLEKRILPGVAQGAREMVKHVYPKSGSVIGPRMILKVTAMNATLKMILGCDISYDDLGSYDEKTGTWSPPGKLSYAAKTAFFFFRLIDATFVCLAAKNMRDVLPWPVSVLAPQPPEFATFAKLSKERNQLWKDVLAEHRTSITKGKPRDWVDEIIENPRGLKDEEIVGLMMDTVIAMSDTFIAFIEWMLALVGGHPDIQKKMQDEIDSIAPDRLIDARDQVNCPYFNAFMMEIFRMYPLTPINPPRRAMVDTELGGYEVPKDTWVFQHWSAMGLREDLWGPDAHEFRPERFLNEKKKVGEMAMNTAAPTVPSELNAFSFGKRSCPGYRLGRVSAFVQGATMIQLFDWKLTKDSDISRHSRLITFPKKINVIPTYRHPVPLDKLLERPVDCSGAWF